MDNPLSDIKDQAMQPINDAKDKVAETASTVGDQASQAADGVQHFADNIDTVIDTGIEQAEQKLDDFIGGLTNFLNKF
jgi:ABC-type transporter Mla subunit MlaD